MTTKNEMPVLTEQEKAGVLRYAGALKNGCLPGGGEYQRHIEKLTAQIALAALDAEKCESIFLGKRAGSDLNYVIVGFKGDVKDMFLSPPVPVMKPVKLVPEINPDMFNADVIFGYRKARKEDIAAIKAAGGEVEE